MLLFINSILFIIKATAKFKTKPIISMIKKNEKNQSRV